MPLHNFGIVTPGIYRGAQPDLNGLKTLYALGVRFVIKLNNEQDQDEEANCSAAGLDLVRHEILVTGNTPDSVRQVVADLAARSTATMLYVHCEHGRDRTGLIVGAWRLLQEQWTYDAVQEEMAVYGVSGIFKILDSGLLAVLRQLASA